MPPGQWKGVLTFGRVRIPIRMVAAVGLTSEERIDFHLLHEEDRERIRNKSICDEGHTDIEGEIVRGHEYERGKWVVVTDEELEALDRKPRGVIDIESFVPSDEIDPIYFDQSYYVIPDESSVKYYRLITEALAGEGLVGIAKVVLREREHLSALRTRNNVMVLHTMHWPKEIREPPKEIDGQSLHEPRDKPRDEESEQRITREEIELLTGTFEPDRFRDEYHEALRELIRRKVKDDDV